MEQETNDEKKERKAIRKAMMLLIAKLMGTIDRLNTKIENE